MCPQDENLLSRLTGNPSQGSDPWSTLAATEPDHDPAPEQGSDPKLDALLSRIRGLTGAAEPAASAVPSTAAEPAPTPPDDSDSFVPIEPKSFRDAQLTDSEVEALVLKYLLARGDAVGRDIAEQIRLPFVLVDELLWKLKTDQLLVHRGSAPMNDYQYQLTDMGRERARRYAQTCSYFGSAPVALNEYIAAVAAQSLTSQHPSFDAVQQAFDGMLLNRRMLDRLGPAINSGRGLFLYGSPGNGKTSIAERVTRAFGQHIWIPRAIGVDGEIIRLFDPVNHIESPLKAGSGILDQSKIDKRWVRIERPTIIAGGELTMSALEVTINTSTGICEAPLQLKSNCGTLVVDDFGRQRMRVEELLNRWIVPLERRIDFLNLPNGKKINVPFDQLIIFSTNLEPRDLVDEAFLRRIPYKIEVIDPTEEEFHDLFRLFAPQMGFEYEAGPVEYLIQNHYKRIGRPFRFCQPRDLLLQVRNYCLYQNIPLELTNDYFDQACQNYFAVM